MVIPLRVLRGAGSPQSLAALATPLLLAAAAAGGGRIAWSALFTSRAVLCWLALLSVALLANCVAAWMERGFTATLLPAAGALLVGQGLVSALLTFDGTADAGEGEEAPPFTVAFSGLAARPPSLKAASLPARRDGRARLVVAGQEMEVKVGEEASARAGVVVRVADVFAAPSFVVRRTGEDEEAAFLKIAPGKRDYFEAGKLPHRFYVSMPDLGPGTEVGIPERIRILIQRGKIRVFDGEVARSEPTRLEGLTIAFAAGSSWAPIRVRSTPRPWLAAVAVGLALGAALLGFTRRRPG